MAQPAQLTKTGSAAHTTPTRSSTRRPQTLHERLGRVNWRGTYTLFIKEVRRFLNVWTQTLAAPVVTAMLFFTIFTIALGAGRDVGDIPLEAFLAPGLVMMTMAQNAFANTSSSLTIAKVQGTIVDVLMPPLSSGELTFAIALGGAARGVLVGLVTAIFVSIFAPMHIHSLAAIVFFGIAGSLMLSLMGLIGGIWAEKFDHIAAVTNFFVTPLTFLSGTFYRVDRLPENWDFIAHFNPFFYMIDGFRYGFIGQSDGSPWIGVAVLVAVNSALWWLAWRMFRTGYRLKP